MKLVNHRKENYTFDDTQSGSVMNGTIFVSEKEWKEIIKSLRKAYSRAKATSNTQIRDGLHHVFSWLLPTHGNDKRICLGVAATSLIVLKYDLKNYKRQNYVIQRN